MSFIRPINDSTPKVTNPFSSTHKGTDYGYNVGEPVYASESGEIIASVNNYTTSWITSGALTTKDYGNYIKIRHQNNYTTLYAHLRHDSLLFGVGQQVEKGQKIAEVGNTGNSSGPHLHWEIRYDEIVTDPSPLLDTSFNYNSSTTTMDRRPYWFDLINKVIWNKPFEEITDQMVNDWIKDYPTQRNRSGLWDKLAIKAGYTGNTNILSVNDLYNLILASGGEAFAAKIVELEALLAKEKALRQSQKEEIKKKILALINAL
jgi:hypothetical protein